MPAARMLSLDRMTLLILPSHSNWIAAVSSSSQVNHRETSPRPPPVNHTWADLIQDMMATLPPGVLAQVLTIHSL